MSIASAIAGSHSEWLGMPSISNALNYRIQRADSTPSSAITLLLSIW